MGHFQIPAPQGQGPVVGLLWADSLRSWSQRRLQMFEPLPPACANGPLWGIAGSPPHPEHFWWRVFKPKTKAFKPGRSSWALQSLVLCPPVRLLDFRLIPCGNQVSLRSWTIPSFNLNSWLFIFVCLSLCNLACVGALFQSPSFLLKQASDCLVISG